MENLLKKHIEKIDTGFYLTKSLLVLLFLISISGLLIGIFGWFFSPAYLWKLTNEDFVMITLAAFVLLGLTLAGNRNTQRLAVIFSELQTE